MIQHYCCACELPIGEFDRELYYYFSSFYGNKYAALCEKVYNNGVEWMNEYAAISLDTYKIDYTPEDFESDSFFIHKDCLEYLFTFSYFENYIKYLSPEYAMRHVYFDRYRPDSPQTPFTLNEMLKDMVNPNIFVSPKNVVSLLRNLLNAVLKKLVYEGCVSSVAKQLKLSRLEINDAVYNAKTGHAAKLIEAFKHKIHLNPPGQMKEFLGKRTPRKI